MGRIDRSIFTQNAGIVPTVGCNGMQLQQILVTTLGQHFYFRLQSIRVVDAYIDVGNVENLLQPPEMASTAD
ncbi:MULTISPECIES: hypothetical protein [Pseudomonas]|uniref:Uncharacterized protein n=2 Tax=Pseudomonas TaxID=286 RepID=A0A7Y8G3L4_9PSED|nr:MULTISPECIES: hypothetical protein [Pseudomonas]MBK3433498.1 hypothetical protein [Pseudomonas fluorescens]MCF5668339.1 hypothetical protein [Pseudomonas marginalis]MBK3481172.1 hypothetical protein [Pseudomonas fluorescens]MCF5720703.1 hypothetical protein [Pseudomonas syringae]MCF9016765.1 hypothetical protein [Pseudomonas syringae]